MRPVEGDDGENDDLGNQGRAAYLLLCVQIIMEFALRFKIVR